MSTTFPNATQSFKQWQDLTSEQLTAYVNYVNALNSGNWTAARNIFQTGRLSTAMLPTAKDFNEMCDTILECKALYEAPTTSAQGIQDFMAQFAYKGVWSASNISQYKKFSIVRYSDPANGTYLYIANQDITTTQTPWANSLINNPQWLRIVPVSIVNANSTFKGAWGSSANYVAGDVVSYNDALYKASASNNNVPPAIGGEVASQWALLFDMNPYIAQLSPTQPTNMLQGTIWFKQL